MPEKFKSLAQNPTLFLTILLFAIAVTSFFLGRLSVVAKSGVSSSTLEDRLLLCPTTICPTVDQAASAVLGVASSNQSVSSANNGAQSASMEYVASRAGTRYHHITCPGAKQIKEENKLFFAQPAAAEAAGYTRAANCNR